MIYVPTYESYLANNANRLKQALELSKCQRHRFKSIVRTFFIADYGYHHDVKAIRQIMGGECEPLETNMNMFLSSLTY